jgi:hypothetical protein
MKQIPLFLPSPARAAALGAALGALVAAQPLAAADADADAELLIELNKLEDTEEGCRSLFVFDNATGHELNRFQVDLILFDQKGVYARQVMLDMAPLSEDKKVLASFLLPDQQCAAIGSILVNGLPQCQDGAGAELDCVELLEVRSLTDTPLEK